MPATATSVLQNDLLSQKIHADQCDHLVQFYETNESLGQAEQASLRARDLTQQLLTFSKGGAPIKKLGSMAAFLRDSATFALRDSTAQLSLDIAGNLWSAHFDAGQMNQVIDNLLINAAQAMPNGGRVVVSARNESRAQAMSIS